MIHLPAQQSKRTPRDTCQRKLTQSLTKKDLNKQNNTKQNLNTYNINHNVKGKTFIDALENFTE